MPKHSHDVEHLDDLTLKRTIKQLCSSTVRYPMDNDTVRMWLNQFADGPEKRLALLILRFLIYRTSEQLSSSIKQGLKSAAKHFMPDDLPKTTTSWKDLLIGDVGDLRFYYGPPNHTYARPGKSGEIISRLIHRCIPIRSEQLQYPKDFSQLKKDERFFLIDDASYTGNQLVDCIRDSASFMGEYNCQTGIVVAIAHEDAVSKLGRIFPHVPVFFGELLTPRQCFLEVCSGWVEDDLWPFRRISPVDQYRQIVRDKAKFAITEYDGLGYGGLGCMVAYEHGVPDDSLQLLWGESETWQPLFKRL